MTTDDELDVAAAPAVSQPVVATRSTTFGRRAVFAQATPSDVRALQRVSGNRLVSRAITAGALARAPAGAPFGGRWLARSSRYTANQADLASLRATMQELSAALDYQTRMTLINDKTIAIGLVTDSDGTSTVVYTVSNNWINPSLREAARKLSITRWEATPRAQGRGAVGAPADAEQLMMDAAETNDFTVDAMAISRPVCVDCNDAIHGYSDGPIKVVVQPVTLSAADQSIRERVKKLREVHDRLLRELELMESEHKAQRHLIYDPSFKGFWGFWTNELFNRQPPDLIIWTNTYSLLARARSAMNAGLPEAALNALLQARRAFLFALKHYVGWKDGLPGAAKKMEYAIGAVAVAAVVAFVAPTVVARVASSASSGAGAATAEQTTMIRIAEVVGRADTAMLRFEQAVLEEEFLVNAAMQAERVMFRALPPF